jgi:hypothetical protein
MRTCPAWQQQLARDMPHRRELCALADRLWPARAANFAAFQFGGYWWHTGGKSYGHLYDDPELEMAEKKLRGRLTGIDRTEGAFLVEQQLQRVRREWLPLVQFRTRDDVYFGRFMIRVDDLAAQRFERANPAVTHSGPQAGQPKGTHSCRVGLGGGSTCSWPAKRADARDTVSEHQSPD